MYRFVGFIHRKGVSKKTNNEYDFFQCFFLVPLASSDNTNGFEAASFNVNPELFYRADLAGNLNKNCSVYFNRFGRIDGIEVSK